MLETIALSLAIAAQVAANQPPEPEPVITCISAEPRYYEVNTVSDLYDILAEVDGDWEVYHCEDTPATLGVIAVNGKLYFELYGY